MKKIIRNIMIKKIFLIIMIRLQIVRRQTRIMGY